MAHRPAPDAPVASHADIEQRIRRFYSYWDDAVGDIPSKDALPSDRIDIELEVLPEDEAARQSLPFSFKDLNLMLFETADYEARQAYVASGFIVRGFYPNVRGEHRTVKVNGRFGVRSQTIPTAIARCVRTEDPISFPKAEQIRRDNTWAVVFQKQAHPVWQQIDSRGRVLNEIDLGFLVCFPRILGIQASVRNVKKEQANELAMDEWLNRCTSNNAAFTKSSGAIVFSLLPCRVSSDSLFRYSSRRFHRSLVSIAWQTYPTWIRRRAKERLPKHSSLLTLPTHNLSSRPA